MRVIAPTTSIIALLFCLSALAAQPVNPCSNKKASELTACLKANPPKNAAGSPTAPAAQQGAEQAALAKMQSAVNQKSNADKTKADQMHNAIKNIK